MKTLEKKPETVYRIIDKTTGEPCGSYSRACCDEFDFSSVESARESNCHGMFKDPSKYKIAKYKVTYELLDGDCDNAEPIKPRPDGMPWDFDTWSNAQQIGYLLGYNAGAGCFDKEIKDSGELFASAAKGLYK